MLPSKSRVLNPFLLILLLFVAPFGYAQTVPPTNPANPTPSPTTSTAPSPTIATPDSTRGNLGRLVQVLHSDQGFIKPSQKILRGNVRLKQDDTYIETNEVTDEFTKSEILLVGNVKIVRGNDVLVAQKVVYNTITKVATTSGNSLVSNRTTRVRAPSALFYTDESKVVFNQGVVVQDSTVQITARSGTYFTNTKQGTFSGNVVVRDGKTVLNSNSATYNTQTKYGTFAGNVVIRDGTTTLRSTTAEYSTELRNGLFNEPMSIQDGKTNIQAKRGEYDTGNGIGKFFEDVTLKDSTLTLKSKSGIYYRQEQTAFFFGNVVLHHTDFYLEADSVSHFRKTDVTIANGNVFLERIPEERNSSKENRDASRTFLFGRKLDHNNQQKRTLVTGNPFAIQLKPNPDDKTKTDTLMIRAKVLDLTDQEGLQRMIAQKNVRLWRNSFAAQMDSLVYLKRMQEAPKEPTTQDLFFLNPSGTRRANARDEAALATNQERLWLFQSPMAWMDNNQVTGDTMQVNLRDSKTDSLFVRGNAFIAQYDSTLAKINQLKGKRIVGQFLQDSLRTLRVAPDASALFFNKDEAGNLSQGTEFVATWILMTFANGKIKMVDAYKPEGKIYEASILPDPFQLTGFRWLPDKRPKKSDFPITTAMKRRIEARLGRR